MVYRCKDCLSSSDDYVFNAMVYNTNIRYPNHIKEILPYSYCITRNGCVGIVVVDGNDLNTVLPISRCQFVKLSVDDAAYLLHLVMTDTVLYDLFSL